MTNQIEHFKGEIILVTGGAGAIGNNLSLTLAKSGAAKVIILDDLSASYKWNIPNLPNVLFVYIVREHCPSGLTIFQHWRRLANQI